MFMIKAIVRVEVLLNYISIKYNIIVVFVYVHEGHRMLQTPLNIMQPSSTPPITKTTMLKHSIALKQCQIRKTLTF